MIRRATWEQMHDSDHDVPGSESGLGRGNPSARDEKFCSITTGKAPGKVRERLGE